MIVATMYLNTISGILFGTLFVLFINLLLNLLVFDRLKSATREDVQMVKYCTPVDDQEVFFVLRQNIVTRGFAHKVGATARSYQVVVRPQKRNKSKSTGNW